MTTAARRATKDAEVARLRAELTQAKAQQAELLIDNGRLRTELQERNRTIQEGLARETATGEILRVIAAGSTDPQQVFDAAVASAARLLGADSVCLWLREGESARRGVAAANIRDPGVHEGLQALAAEWRRQASPRPLHRGAPFDVAILDAVVVQVPDAFAPEANRFASAIRGAARRWGWRRQLNVPLVRDGRALGVITLFDPRVGPWSNQEIALVQTFADQAVIAIENARLFSELNETNTSLTEALEQQTATAEVLQSISRSAFDLQSVLDTLVENAVRLTRADIGVVLRAETDHLAVWAHHGASAAFLERVRVQPVRYDPATTSGRAATQRRVVRIDDVQADAQYRRRDMQEADPYRSTLAVPLLRGEQLLGVITVWKRRLDPFTERQVELIRTFADQAVVAMENTRLFSELQERDDRRRQELERASAIQQRLLPERVDGWPGVLEVAVRFRPAVETSGDFYDVLPLTPARPGELPPLQIAVGDVAGKGMSAALVAALARSALRATSTIPVEVATPAAVLRLAGRRLHQDVGSGNFVACALAVVEPPGRHNVGPLLRLANAAQVPVLLVRDGTVREVEPPGYRLPLGAQDDGAYKEAEVELRPGDAVVFSSDGLVEAPAQARATVGEHLPPAAAQSGELFGFERLAAAARHWAAHAETAEAVAEGIWRDVTAWAGEAGEGAPRRGASAEGRPLGQHDDMTLLVLRVPG